MKSDFRLGRNFYKGVFGDAVNALLAAAAYNFKRAMRFPWTLVEKNQRDTLLEKCLAGIYFFKGRLGRLYYEDGDYVNAVKYLTMASQSDTSGAASFLLSKCYRNGFGVPQDVAKADSLQKKALEKGWDEAKSLDDLLKGVFD